ncbi:hypothetical protein C8K30_10982 [Promicromonospora sp. AC04]|nr:hypothetical protein C8K30_10982 [Promicromonospora sp. AC04]
MRRFRVLTPMAVGVSAVVYLILYLVFATGSGVGVIEVGVALLVVLLAALVATAVVLAVLLIAVGLLRLLGVNSAWAALGLAFGLTVVVLGIIYAGIAASMQPGDPGFNMLILLEAAGVQIPVWLTFAVGLLVGDRREQAARSRVSPTP